MQTTEFDPKFTRQTQIYGMAWFNSVFMCCVLSLVGVSPFGIEWNIFWIPSHSINIHMNICMSRTIIKLSSQKTPCRIVCLLWWSDTIRTKSESRTKKNTIPKKEEKEAVKNNNKMKHTNRAGCWISRSEETQRAAEISIK